MNNPQLNRIARVGSYYLYAGNNGDPIVVQITQRRMADGFKRSHHLTVPLTPEAIPDPTTYNTLAAAWYNHTMIPTGRATAMLQSLPNAGIISASRK